MPERRNLTRVDRAAQTRRALVAAARLLFVSQGYARTSVEQIVAESGAGTKGAFYHYVPDKEAAFAAVFEEIQADLATAAQALVPIPGADHLATLNGLLSAFLTGVSRNPEARALLIQGPSALGWERFRSLEMAYGTAGVEGWLDLARAEGSLPAEDTRTLAVLVVAMVDAAAHSIAVSDRAAQSLRDSQWALAFVIDGLRTCRRLD